MGDLSATDSLYLRDAYLRAVLGQGGRRARRRGGPRPHRVLPHRRRPAPRHRRDRWGDVTDVRKDGHVWHVIDGVPPAVGDDVEGEIDWDRRHALMRTHTALHVLCGVIWNEWGKCR